MPLLVFSGAPADTAFNTATFAYIADVMPPGRRGEAYGIIMLTFTIAALISAPLGAFLADLWAETHSIYLFRVCAGAALLPVLFACFFIAEPTRLGQALDERQGGKKKHKKGFAGLRPLLLGPLGAYLVVNFLTSMESAGKPSTLCFLASVESPTPLDLKCHELGLSGPLAGQHSRHLT